MSHDVCVTSSIFSAAYVEFENLSYVVGEGDGVKKICLNAEGYGFSVDITATYQDGSTEGTYSAAVDKKALRSRAHILLCVL